MSYAERYPQFVKALVIEDMDIRVRPMEMNMFRSKSNNRDATISFERDLGVLSRGEGNDHDGDSTSDEEKLIEIFVAEGYPQESVGKWLKEGRIDKQKQPSSSSFYYFSEVNPAFRLLCYEQFFITDHGEQTWLKLAKQSKHYNFPIHVMVADQDKTVCDEESIWLMKNMMKNDDRFMVLHRYKGATHSIHNSSMKEFLGDLRTIIHTASLG
eukprot:CAMPEP_0197251578 /NCGR_PEP_ID=MMETSP1429-20130617/57694_1 /TAXON_ID=49237 /ORGANISM="Chaetoceros  sp., Strain UNC1202" /LENGTH=211 /DNA_ID=CAMNT_0042713695 /DNA_START=8 /DNA_END=643 /DNA_ORIENTATION=-